MATELLDKEFVGVGEVQDIKFKQLKASPQAYIYRVTSDGNTYYEVIKRIAVARMEDFETRTYSTTDFKEVYPKAKHFGKTAWTYASIEDAKARFESLGLLES